MRKGFWWPETWSIYNRFVPALVQVKVNRWLLLSPLCTAHCWSRQILAFWDTQWWVYNLAFALQIHRGADFILDFHKFQYWMWNCSVRLSYCCPLVATMLSLHRPYLFNLLIQVSVCWQIFVHIVSVTVIPKLVLCAPVLVSSSVIWSLREFYLFIEHKSFTKTFTSWWICLDVAFFIMVYLLNIKDVSVAWPKRV